MARFQLPNGNIVTDDQQFTLQCPVAVPLQITYVETVTSEVTVPAHEELDGEGKMVTVPESTTMVTEEVTRWRTETTNDFEDVTFFRMADLSPEQRTAYGIVELEPLPEVDHRFYNQVGDQEPVARDMGELKAVEVEHVKANANALLLPLRWKIDRAMTGGAPLDAPTLAYFAAVRARSDQLEDEIAALPNVEALVAWVNSPREWPPI